MLTLLKYPIVINQCVRNRFSVWQLTDMKLIISFHKLYCDNVSLIELRLACPQIAWFNIITPVFSNYSPLLECLWVMVPSHTCPDKRYMLLTVQNYCMLCSPPSFSLLYCFSFLSYWQPKPNYLPNLKNPCWWENVTDPSFRIHDEVNDLRMPIRKLRCLPYFHILCCSKSGTTDLYSRIAQHPDIVPNIGMFGKEQLYWGWSKYGKWMELWSARYNCGKLGHIHYMKMGQA